jgi:hypothetical protein
MDAAGQQQGNTALSMLTSAGAEVDLVGHADLDGTPTTHYVAEVDVRKAVASNGMVSDELADQSVKVLGDTLTMDLWIDDDGYTRRLEYGSDLSALAEPFPGMPADGDLHYVFEMSDFGEPIDVVAPDPSEVISMSEFQESMLGRLGELGDFNAVGDEISDPN